VLGDLTVDRARRVATLGGVALPLRPKEFDLLHYFAQHPEVVHSRDALLRQVWGYDFPIGTRTVDVHVRWLRQKIERNPGKPTRLETVRGVGYRLVPHFANGH
jgi:DNA-binding response OmpR family regulator